MNRQNVKRYIAATALFATLAGIAVPVSAQGKGAAPQARAAAPATLWERLLSWCEMSLAGFDSSVRAKRGAGIDPNGSTTGPTPSDPVEPSDSLINRRGAGIDPNG